MNGPFMFSGFPPSGWTLVAVGLGVVVVVVVLVFLQGRRERKRWIREQAAKAGVPASQWPHGSHGRHIRRRGPDT